MIELQRLLRDRRALVDHLRKNDTHQGSFYDTEKCLPELADLLQQLWEVHNSKQLYGGMPTEPTMGITTEAMTIYVKGKPIYKIPRAAYIGIIFQLAARLLEDVK